MNKKLINIGNSKGVILSKSMQEHLGSSNVTVKITPEGILIAGVTNPREGWEDDFKKMNSLGEDVEALTFKDDLEWEDL